MNGNVHYNKDSINSYTNGVRRDVQQHETKLTAWLLRKLIPEICFTFGPGLLTTFLVSSLKPAAHKSNFLKITRFKLRLVCMVDLAIMIRLSYYSFVKKTSKKQRKGPKKKITSIYRKTIRFPVKIKMKNCRTTII